MFSIRQKREIADKIQTMLRETNHPELPAGEIQFFLHIEGARIFSWADIRNNGAVKNPSANPWNERQDEAQNLSLKKSFKITKKSVDGSRK